MGISFTWQEQGVLHACSAWKGCMLKSNILQQHTPHVWDMWAHVMRCEPNAWYIEAWLVVITGELHMGPLHVNRYSCWQAYCTNDLESSVNIVGLMKPNDTRRWSTFSPFVLFHLNCVLQVLSFEAKASISPGRDGWTNCKSMATDKYRQLCIDPRTAATHTATFFSLLILQI